MTDLEEKSESELKEDFMRDIRCGAMEYYVKHFPKDIPRLYSVDGNYNGRQIQNPTQN